MRYRIPTLTGIVLAAVLAFPATTVAQGFAADHTASSGEPHGVLIGSGTTPTTRDIYQVRFTHINGDRIPSGREWLTLKPGEYEIDATVVANRLQRHSIGLRTTGPRSRRVDLDPLKIVVEEGKTYRVGGLHLHEGSDTRRPEFRLVLWKVSDADGDEHYPLEEEDDESDEDETENDG